jgi:hypothetical protein
MTCPAPQPPTLPVATHEARRSRLADRLRCLAIRVGKIVRAAHSSSVPF